MPQEVDDKMSLDPTDQLQFTEGVDARVADKHIQRQAKLPHCSGTVHRRLEIRQLQRQGGSLALDTGTSSGRLRQGAPRTNNMRTAQGKDSHGLVTYPRITAGNQGDLATQVHAARDLLRCGPGTVRTDREALVDGDNRGIGVARTQHGSGGSRCGKL